MPETPEITSLMLYYGRRNVAEEAVESFLRQTYPHKHLIIVNTHPDPVHFEKDYPNIEVHNIIPDTFENLNEKYNYAFSQIRTNWWCPWDSDDIWLPWHFENLAAGIPKKKGKHPLKIGIKTCYFANDNIIHKIGWNMWGNCIYETLDAKGNLHAGCDSTIAENCDSQILLKKNWTRCWLEQPRSFIFRWDQKQHGSAYMKKDGADLEYHKRCKAKMYAKRNTEPFRPHWDRDYVQDVKDFETRLQKENQHEISNII